MDTAIEGGKFERHAMAWQVWGKWEKMRMNLQISILHMV